MPEPKPAPPPTSAPALGEILEQALVAVVDPSVFRRAAARPAPSFGAAAGLVLGAGAASLAVNLIHVLVSNPGFLQRFSSLVVAAVGAAALAAYAGATLLLAAALYAAGTGLGGKGEFARGLQAAAMISALGPVQMLCNWFPAAWIVPALLAAWVAAGALTGLFGARPGPARALCAVLAVGALGLQAAGRAFTERAQETYAAARAAQNVSIATEDLTRSMQEFSRQTQAGAADSLTPAAPLPTSPLPAASGLDLLRGPSGDAPVGSPSLAQARMPPPGLAAAAQGMQTNALGMLDAVTPMIDMLASAKNTAPQQKADLQELKGLISDLKAQIASGKKIDNAAYAERTARYQKLLMKVMAAAAVPTQGGK